MTDPYRLISRNRTDALNELVPLLVKIARSGSAQNISGKFVQVLELGEFIVTGMQDRPYEYYVRVDRNGGLVFSAWAAANGDHHVMTWKERRHWELDLCDAFDLRQAST